MTRLSASHAAPRIPATVILAELSIAAGMAGCSVALCYHDYPAPLLCELWSRTCQSFADDQVYHVRTAADARKLEQRVGSVRVVLVHDARQLNTVSWIVQLHAPRDSQSRPAVFTSGAALGLDDSPGATLVLVCNADESQTIEPYLFRSGPLNVDWSNINPPHAIECDERLQPVLRHDITANVLGVRRFRNHLILHGLLAGACVLRQSRAINASPGNTLIDLEDYRLVRGLLQTPVVCSSDELCDQLAIDMINRANTYLSVKYGPGSIELNPLAAEDYDQYVHGRGGPPRRELVTRKEIADLGNTRSQIVRQLVEYLKRQSDGHEAFTRMGLCRRPPNQDRWRTLSLGDLTACLRRWTYKQVRNRFDRLHQEKLVTAERDQGNGPWLYTLPEELSNFASPFRNLPTADELTLDCPTVVRNRSGVGHDQPAGQLP